MIDIKFNQHIIKKAQYQLRLALAAKDFVRVRTCERMIEEHQQLIKRKVISYQIEQQRMEEFRKSNKLNDFKRTEWINRVSVQDDFKHPDDPVGYIQIWQHLCHDIISDFTTIHDIKDILENKNSFIFHDTNPGKAGLGFYLYMVQNRGWLTLIDMNADSSD